MAFFSSFKSYRTGTGPLDRQAVIDWSYAINDSMKKASLSNPFSLYARLVEHLASAQNFDVRPLAELMQPIAEGKVRIALRHDLDSTLPAGLKAARLLEQTGMAGSFYFLHTTRYYGEVSQGVFLRQPGFESLLHDFIKTGCEIGLHIDPLHLYLEHGVDGVEAVREELNWLRQAGADVKGIVAHNSAALYGAENFEIFHGLSLGNRQKFKWKNITVPLHTVNMADLGLQYEGNFPGPPEPDDAYLLSHYVTQCPPDCLRRPDWQSIYFSHNPVFSRPNDISLWLVGRDQWVIAEHRPVRRLYSNITSNEIFTFLDQISPQRRVVIVVHPEYIGDELED